MKAGVPGRGATITARLDLLRRKRAVAGSHGGLDKLKGQINRSARQGEFLPRVPGHRLFQVYVVHIMCIMQIIA